MKSTLILFSLWFALCSCKNNQIKKGKLPHAQAEQVYTYAKASPDGTGKFYFGREISQVMSSDGAKWLERNKRQEEENVDLAIENLQLKPTDIVADIGAGTGYYSFRITQKVPEGKVFAVEIQDDFISFLQSKKNKLHTQNLEVIKGTSHSALLPENVVDVAIMTDVYHELEFPREMLQSIRRSLKEDGRLLLIEYKGEDSTISIEPLHKTTITQLNKELQSNGFVLSYDGEFLPIQHFLIYKKLK
ncbi:MAG: class I SAM-dependent methyltransferase [Ginsengibacter sp.]